MRIGILNTQVPFITGGAERHAANLCKAFRERGFDATEISMPFKWYPAKTLVDHVMAAKLVDLSEVEGTPVDLAIGLKFPAYLAQHPSKVFWILHQHRQAYDMWESGISELLDDPDGAAVRALIREEDRRALGAPGATVFANSENVAGRLLRFLNLPSTPLYHPPPNAERMRQGAYGDYLFAPSRMNTAKRQKLILEALAQSGAGTRIVFAGPADSPRFFNELKADARRLGVADRVTWLGAVDDETMIRCYAEARGVVFIPIDEDYGYITLEAMLSGKPVITATDSGGALEFIDDGAEGFVVPPEAGPLVAAFDRLMDDAALAERMGAAGYARYTASEIGWDSVVRTLTAGANPGADPLGTDPAALLRAPNRGLSAPIIETEPETPPVDIDTLKAKITPTLPNAPPFRNIEALLGAYEFGTYRTQDGPDLGTLAPYFQTHWRRYLATLALVLESPTDHVLDVGLFPPFLFQALLSAARPGIRLDGVWEGPAAFSQTVRSLREGVEDFDVALQPANVERDPLPFGAGTFDLVLGMEILEHLAIDPLFFVTEAARVLRPGGRIILTTPNIVSHRGVRKMLDGDTPYSFGLFVPTGGVYGRHNREYTPHEVACLCEAAGFVTEQLATADVYDDHIDPEVAALIAHRGPFELRGETILYVGRLEAHRAVPERPEGLYHGDPRQLSGGLQLLERDTRTGAARIAVENRSSVLWNACGDDSVSFYLEWFDERGARVHGDGCVHLDGPLGPGETVEITLPLDPGPTAGSSGILQIDLYQTGAGRMTAAGRANALRLPCSEAAFLRLAGAEPS